MFYKQSGLIFIQYNTRYTYISPQILSLDIPKCRQLVTDIRETENVKYIIYYVRDNYITKGNRVTLKGRFLPSCAVGVVCGSDCSLSSLKEGGEGGVVWVSWGVVWGVGEVSSSLGGGGHGVGMALLRVRHSSSQPWTLATSNGVTPFCRNEESRKFM